MSNQNHKKAVDQNLYDALVLHAADAVHSYEDYLMDRIDWRKLARVMTILRETVETIDSSKLRERETK